MSNTYDLIIKSGKCLVTTDSGEIEEQSVDIGVQNGQITHIGSIETKESDPIFDASGLHVLPGFIDTQVHFREPGLEYKETIASGTLGAILGGITGVFEMPNTTPPTTSALALKDKLSRAENSAWSHYAFFIGAAEENADKLEELEKLPGCCGVKIFMGSSTGNLLVDDVTVLKRALQSGCRRVAIHCEDEARLKERKKLLKDHQGDPSFHPEWRDEETAFLATNKLVELAKAAHRPAHVLHITTKKEMEFLKEQKNSLITVETTPQHLTLSAPSCYEEIGTLAQMNPPIRTEEHQAALWEGVNNGTVDVIGSDHAPHTLAEKEKPYPASPSGMPGVQTTVPIMLNHVANGKLSLIRLVELMAATPAKIYKIKNKGAICLGKDADFTIVDLKAKKIITNSWIASRSGWTPFHGKKVTGWPVATILNGRVVMRDGQVIGSPSGQAFQFL